MYLLGISAFYHDSAAALLHNGVLIAAAQEERFTRKKHDAAFPQHAIQYCLEEAQIELSEVSYVTFYEKPFLKFERLLETYLSYAPRGIRSFWKSMPLWIKEKLFQKRLLQKQLLFIDSQWDTETLLFCEHHQSHAASAFFPSPFEEALVLTVDGVGEWVTTAAAKGRQHELTTLKEIHFPHSLGLLYSAFTDYIGFEVNGGEYKLMGLAPYGTPKYVETIFEHLIDVKADGSFSLNMEYFNYAVGLTMTTRAFHLLFGSAPREPEDELNQRHMDLAASIQEVISQTMVRLVSHLHQETPCSNLCLAGGVALNCVTNGRLLRETPFENIWIQPAAGDAGGAVGAAFATWHQFLDQPRRIHSENTMHAIDAMHGARLGPSFSNESIQTFLETHQISAQQMDDTELYQVVADHLANGKVVGWFQGRMEFGPRALGGRSILADPRNPEMQSRLNNMIKHREPFRPVAPSILKEHLKDYFDLDHDSPYMLLVASVSEKQRRSCPKQKGDDLEEEQQMGLDRLEANETSIPAVIHVDGSARIQTVGVTENIERSSQSSASRYRQLLEAFYEKTACPLLINTSFNRRDEPIVCTPKEAYECFQETGIDLLVLGSFVIN